MVQALKVGSDTAQEMALRRLSLSLFATFTKVFFVKLEIASYDMKQSQVCSRGTMPRRITES